MQKQAAMPRAAALAVCLLGAVSDTAAQEAGWQSEVVELTASNFAAAVTGAEVLLVEFYGAPARTAPPCLRRPACALPLSALARRGLGVLPAPVSRRQAS